VTSSSFLADQRAEVRVLDIETGEQTVLFSSDTLFVEAPNWHPNGEHLVLNAEGGLLRLPLDESSEREAKLEPVETPPELVLNNDHVISPDGENIYVTARDGHLYRLPWRGGDATRLTLPSDPARRFKYYLHGVSPDGLTLAAVGGGVDASGVWVTNICTLPAAGGAHRMLTEDAFADDGPEFSADGEHVWFNSEREAARPGHAQIFRMGRDGGAPTRVTHDERVNWFPHPSPDGRHILYLSYPAATIGHPPNLDVELRLIDEATGRIRTVASFFGGQGSSNVPAWSPDSRRVAFVAYPVSASPAGA
jgi:TolB protein